MLIAPSFVQGEVSAPLLPSYRNETGNCGACAGNWIAGGRPCCRPTPQRRSAKCVHSTGIRWRRCQAFSRPVHRRARGKHKSRRRPCPRAGWILETLPSRRRHSLARSDRGLLLSARGCLCSNALAYSIQLCSRPRSPDVCCISHRCRHFLLPGSHFVLASAPQIDHWVVSTYLRGAIGEPVFLGSRGEEVSARHALNRP